MKCLTVHCKCWEVGASVWASRLLLLHSWQPHSCALLASTSPSFPCPSTYLESVCTHLYGLTQLTLLPANFFRVPPNRKVGRRQLIILRAKWIFSDTVLNNIQVLQYNIDHRCPWNRKVKKNILAKWGKLSESAPEKNQTLNVLQKGCCYFHFPRLGFWGSLSYGSLFFFLHSPPFLISGINSKLYPRVRGEKPVFDYK